MNKSVIYASLGALLTALLVAMLVSSYTSGKNAPNTRSMPQVLVAAADLPAGTVLSASNARFQSWPTQNPPANAILKTAKDSSWQGRKLRRALSKDETILPSTLVAKASGSFLAASLDNNMRAVAIEVKADTSAGGFMAPGDFVDVILTYPVRVQDSSGGNNLQSMAIENAAETILQAVRVLAVDQDATEATRTTAKVAKTITLQVDDAGAKKIALGKKMGDLSLALRPLGDDKAKALSPVSDVSMLPLNQHMINARQGQGQTIRVYSGGQVSAVPVRPNVRPNVTPNVTPNAQSNTEVKK
jgi:pilus assembly protein CpaB